ncbi:MAG: hypothetical protein IIC56_02990 [Proteobacteria bacterium]|nr:hypothetical protein [Pseudomonadota bacterium]
MTATRRLSILIPGLIPALIPGLLLAVAGLAAAPAGAALKPDPKCGKPRVSSKAVYPKEPVSYTLEKHPEFKSAGKPLGLFQARESIGYRIEIQGGCLKSLAVKITAQPSIFLRSIYKKKTRKCARKSVLSHERGHGRIAKKQYKALAARIKKMAVKLFTGKAVPDVKTVGAELDAKLKTGVIPGFKKRYDAAQKGFHTKIAQAELIRRGCKLVKRKRY